MPRELIFTSVPSGVNPGSTGYCTVAKHKGIDRLLDKAVEEICFYEMMNSPTKPIVHAYRIIRLNTGTFHILSRICYSGSDHTGRTNYLAHNLIFDQAETYAQTVSPAEIFLRGTGWLSAWTKGAPPAFLNEGTCKVFLPASSSAHGSLQTWANFTGNGNLAHELGGRGQWKLITQGGEHQSSLSLLAEFASLPGTPNQQLCWSQLTFTTYLQPSDKPEDFKVVSGDASVPAFAALARDTLNLSSPGVPGQCFSEAGSSTFGPLPALNQPAEAKVEPQQPVTPTAGQAATAQEAAPDPFADDEPEEAVAAAGPAQASNLNLGPIDLPTKGTGPTDLPSGTKAYRQRAHRTASIQAPKKSKAPAILFSVAGVSLLAVAVFALIYFWPKKATIGEDETAKSDNNEQPSEPGARPETNPIEDSNDPEETNLDSNAQAAKVKQREKEDHDRLAKLKKILVKPPDQQALKDQELVKLKELKRELDNQLKAISNAKQAIPKDLEKQAKNRQTELAGLIKNKEAARKDELAAKNTKLPDKILIDDKFLPSGQFSLIPEGKPSSGSPKIYAYKAGQVTEKGEQSFPPAFWVDGTKVYLLKDKTYQVKKGRFRDIKNLDEYGIISPAKEIPKSSKFKTQLTNFTYIFFTEKSGTGVLDGNSRRYSNFGRLAYGFIATCEKTITGDVLYKVTTIHEGKSTPITYEDIKDIYKIAKPRIAELWERVNAADTNLGTATTNFKEFLKIAPKDSIKFGNLKFEKTIQDKLVAKIGAISFEWEDDETKEKKSGKLPAGWNTGDKVKKYLFPQKPKKSTFPEFRALKNYLVQDKEAGWKKQLDSAQAALKKARTNLDKNKDQKKTKNLENAIEAALDNSSAKRKLSTQFKSKFSDQSKYDAQKAKYSELRTKLDKYISDKRTLPAKNSIPELEAFIDNLGVLSNEVKPPWHWKEKDGNRIILEVIE